MKDLLGGESTSERFALFSQLSYLPKNKRNSFLDKYKKISWKIDDKLSNKFFTTVVNNKTGEVILSVRGTNPKNISDLKEDLFIATGTQGLLSKRLKNGKKLLEKVMAKYGKEKLTITGHSLGGSIASKLSKKYDVTGHIYNKGSSPISSNILVSSFNKVKCYLKECKQNKNKTTHHNISTDPVSISTAIHKEQHEKVEKVVKKKGENPHSLENFIPDLNDVTGEGAVTDFMIKMIKKYFESRKPKGEPDMFGKNGLAARLKRGYGSDEVKKTKTKKVRKSNPWITHVKEYQKKNNCSYKIAMREAGKTYK